MKVKIEFEIKPFDVPDHVIKIIPPKPRQGGVSFDKEKYSIPLSELPAETLHQLCNAFRTEVFVKAGKELTEK